MGTFTSFLFAEPSFLEGAARVMDLGGTLDNYNRARTGEEADALAMWSDWLAVGADVVEALRQFTEERSTEAARGNK